MSQESNISYNQAQKLLQWERNELAERIRILEVFLEDRLKDIPDYKSLFKESTEHINTTILSWISGGDLLSLRGVLVYVTEFSVTYTKTLVVSIEYALCKLTDDIQYFNVVEELLKFRSINFTRIICDSNISQRQKLSPEGIKRLNELIPILMKYDGKFNHIISYLEANEQYITNENRALIMSCSDKINDLTSIKIVFRSIGKLSNSQLLDVCLHKEGPCYCFIILEILQHDKTISSEDIQRICTQLRKKGVVGELGTILLQRQNIAGVCTPIARKRILEGNYSEFMECLQKFENHRRLKEATAMEGHLMDFRLAAQLMHHYMFISHEVPLLGLLPRQCIDSVPSETEIKRYRILKVYHDAKIMILSEETDMTNEAALIPLLNIGDEIELKFTCPRDTLIPEVVECRLANVNVINMPGWLDYKKRHHAVVVSRESFVDYTVQLT